MTTQRALQQPEFYYQFETVFSQFKEHTALQKELLARQEVNKKDLENWQKSVQELNESQAQGLNIHPFTWQTKDKELEAIKVTKSQIPLGLERLQYTVDVTSKKLIRFWDDIYAEYQNRDLSREKFFGYIKKYKEIFDVAIDPTTIKDHVLRYIKKDIESFLKN